MAFRERASSKFSDRTSDGAATMKAALEGGRGDYFDPFMADRDLRIAYRALMDGDWRRLESFLESSPKAWIFSSVATSELVGVETIVFSRWADVADSARARIFLAAGLIRDAFEKRTAFQARTTNSVEYVSEAETVQALGVFEEELKEAERMLYEIVRQRPGLADPWVFLLISGRGLGVRLEELRQRFDNAHSRDPFRADACREYLEGLTEKWGGSDQAAFDFARWIEREAPVDSPSRVVTPVVHIEHGLLEDRGARLADYLNSPEVVASLVTSLRSFLDATPSPAPTEMLATLNAYGLAISADSADTAPLVAEVFERIDNRPTSYPWSLYREGIAQVFNEIQGDQLRFASRY